jgi:hypothetical protein
VAQRAIVMVLEAVYEQDFPEWGLSSGFGGGVHPLLLSLVSFFV